MSRSLTPPSAGQPIRASFFAELLREIRANRLLNGTGYRTKRGPNGTSLSIDVPRAAAGKSKDIGLFRIGKKDPEEGEEPSDNLWLFNTYIRLGGSWIAMNGNTEIDTGSPVESYANQFLFLHAISMGPHGPEFSVNMTDDFSVIEQYSCDPTVIAIPLYHFDENGAVDIDFRIGVGTDAFDLMPIESTQEEQT